MDAAPNARRGMDVPQSFARRTFAQGSCHTPTLPCCRGGVGGLARCSGISGVFLKCRAGSVGSRLRRGQGWQRSGSILSITCRPLRPAKRSTIFARKALLALSRSR